jgi:CheY-like chemotaxis protein
MILIVDDHQDTCEVLAKLCERRGLPARYALSGEDALRTLHTDPPRVVVLDQMMPGKTGLDVLEHLAGDGRLDDVQVIFLSAVFDWQSYQKALRLGAKAWLVKGTVRLTDVVDRVADCLAQAG